MNYYSYRPTVFLLIVLKSDVTIKIANGILIHFVKITSLRFEIAIE